MNTQVTERPTTYAEKYLREDRLSTRQYRPIERPVYRPVEAEPYKPARERFSEKKLSARRIARSLVIWTAIIFMLSAAVAGLSAYATNLELLTLETQQNAQRLDERIEELRGNIEKDYNKMLLNTPLTNVEVAEKAYFVKDNWEVGG